MGRARIFPREVSRILTPTGGYLRGFTHSLQPYAGCQFSCVYCYVREMSVQRANPYRLPWSRWIAPKMNAGERLRREARRGSLADARIFCSSATDPYTPLERRLGLTRACLDVMIAHPPALLLVQTRSPLVVRDADLLARMRSAVASVTVTTDDDRVRRLLEPDSPRVSERIETLARLRAAGVRTQAAVSPLLPGDPERLAARLEPWVDRVVVDDFFRGDGAGGARSRAALARLRAAGFGDWAEPGYADAAVEVFRRVLGPERVGVSAEGFAGAASALS
jgi:DNA repair photolyase